MKKYLKKEHYYFITSNDEYMGDFKIYFYVNKINIYPFNSADEFKDLNNDKAYRNNNNSFHYNKYDIDYDIFYSMDIEDINIGINDFFEITNPEEIKIAKEKIEKFHKDENDYLDSIANKYPEY